jgi:hypothetical protein
MSFNHITVDSLIHPVATEEQVVFAGGAIGAENFTVKRANYKWWLGNIPVNKAVYTLGTEIKRVMPWVEFGVVDDHGVNQRTYDRYGSDESVPAICFDEVQVYVPWQQYVLGRIGYRDYGVRELVIAYGVYSRKIKIGKVHKHSSRYNTAISTDLKRATKAAVQNLTPYTVVECAALSYSSFRENIKSGVEEANAEARKLIYRCSPQSVIAAEMANLIRQGVQFVTPEFKEAAAHYLTAKSEALAAETRKTGAYYVNLFTAKDKQYARILTTAGDVKSFVLPTYASREETIIPVEDVPLDVQAKIAVLMSIDNESYAPGVGYRVSANTFWVERELG